jgi:hypothetical protein
MASNVTLNTGSGGAVAATKQITHDGDTAQVQMVGLFGLTGTEDSYTATLVNADSSGLLVSPAGRAAHDAAVSGNPLLYGGYASAAAPSDVSGDGDAVRAWHLRNGAQAIQPTFAGVLGVAGNGASGTGVQRVTIANDSTGILAAVTNVATIGTSVTPGTSATHLGKAVDSAAGGTDTGVALLAVRDDALATLTPADGDYTHLRVDSTGALHVRISGGGVSGVLDDAAFTAGTTELVPMGMVADESSTDSVDEGDIGAPRITLDRKQIVTPYAHAAAGGATPYYNLDVDESEDEVKATAGKLFALHVINLANAKRYLKIYNATAANVTVGTTTPVLSFPIPTMGDTNGAGFTFPIPSCGIQFSTAITIAATTGFADNDTGAPGNNEVIVNLAYI